MTAVVDWLETGEAVLIFAGTTDPAGQQDQLALLAGQQDSTVDFTTLAESIVADSAVSTAAVVVALAKRAIWVSARGASVRWIDEPLGLSIIGRIGTASTNDVVAVRAGGALAVLKVYRLAGSGRGESAALAALAETGLVPRVLTRLVYQPALGPQRVLALVLESVAGVTVDVPLRRGLEAAWQRGDGSLTAADREMLVRVREATLALHAALDQTAPKPDGAGELAPGSGGLLADIEMLRAGVSHERASQMLDQATEVGRVLAQSTRGPGFGHGDLHLSNVIIGDKQVRFIDVTGGAAQPADDFAALRRGVECVCLDLQVDRVGQLRGSPDEVAAALRRVAYGAVPGAEGALFAPLALPGAPGSERAWDHWCGLATLEITGGRVDGADQLAYLTRLIHDLRYHEERGRTYYADLAWWHLARWCLSLAAGAPHA